MGFKLLEIGSCLGETSHDISFYIEHFKKRGKDLEHFYKDITGRKTLYISENKNILEMSLSAINDALRKNNLTGKDIDMIIYCSSVPEYLIPATSLVIHDSIKANPNAFCFDLNANCAGMMHALDLAKEHLLVHKELKRALIIGCEYFSLNSSPEVETTYGQFTDAACAVILEKSETSSDIIGSNSRVDNNYVNAARFPSNGFSDFVFQENIIREDFFTDFPPMNMKSLESVATQQITELLDQLQISNDEIKVTCFSQYNKYFNEKLIKNLNLNLENNIFVAEEIGYTGPSSPFFALKKAVESKKINRGDIILLWTFGLGSSSICQVIRY